MMMITVILYLVCALIIYFCFLFDLFIIVIILLDILIICGLIYGTNLYLNNIKVFFCIFFVLLFYFRVYFLMLILIFICIFIVPFISKRIIDLIKIKTIVYQFISPILYFMNRLEHSLLLLIFELYFEIN